MHSFLEKLTPEQRSTLDRLVELFLAENAITNLSALRTPEACFTGNVLDSLAFTLFAASQRVQAGATLLDIGTGGGFPLLPIAVAFPQITCTGIDSVLKKLKCVERIAKGCNLNNVFVQCIRTEEAGRSIKMREKFDIVTARAVAALPTLLEYCSPFVKVGGHLIIWKSMHIDEEYAQAKAAIRELKLSVFAQWRYELPLDFGERQLLIFTKDKHTPAEYPRAVGLAKQHPIMDA